MTQKAKNIALNANKDYVSARNGLVEATDKLDNVEKHIPKDLMDGVNNATNEVRNLKTKHNTVLNKGKKRTKFENFIDSDHRKASKEVEFAQRNLDELNGKLNRATDKIKYDTMKDMDNFKSKMDNVESSPSMQKMNNMISEQQKAFDKATRNRNMTRAGVGLGVGAGVAGGAELLGSRQSGDTNNLNNGI